jgi:hypothetical protein
MLAVLADSPLTAYEVAQPSGGHRATRLSPTST